MKSFIYKGGYMIKRIYIGFIVSLLIASAVFGYAVTKAEAGGTVWTWGLNYNGQLGDGTMTTTPPYGKTTPVQVSGLTGVTAIAGGDAHTIALKNDGTVWTWGYNSEGQLGDGTTTQRTTPVQVSGLTGVTAITGWFWHTIALKSDGTVWGWGYNGSGQLGDGTTINRYTPVQVSGLTGVTAIAGGQYHTIALKNDGTVWAWGANWSGQLGDGTVIDRYTPVQVSGLTGVTAIARGTLHTAALKSDGTIWTWGYNYFGQLGDGTVIDRYTPVQVSGLTNIVAITGGGYHTIAIKSDDTVWAWGYNYAGQLGDGTTINKYTPVQVSGLTSVTTVAGGYNHTIALKNDGTVWTWGDNYFGELGDGTTTTRYTPVQVNGLTNVTAVAGGWYHTIAIKGQELYTLTITKADTGSGTVTSSPAGIDCGADCSEAYNSATVVTLTPTPDTGSYFAGWSGDADCSDGSVTIDADKTCTALFTLNAYNLNITINPPAGGTVTAPGINCPGDCTESYNYNTSVTITAVANTGYTFDSWTNCDSPSGNQCTMTMNSDKTVTANFTSTSIQYTLAIAKSGEGSVTVVSSPAGINCGADCQEAYNANTVVTLTVTPEPGTIFTGWAGNADCSDGVVTVDATKGCWATFTKPILAISKSGEGSVTVTSNPAGIDCGTDCLEVYNANTVVTLTATPESGTIFTGWAGNADCSDGVVTMDSPDMKTCWATFTKPTLAIAKGGSGTGTVVSSPSGIDCGADCLETYNANTVVSLTATPDIGSTFSYWAGNADCSDGVVTMDTPDTKGCWAIFD
ncbi:MAG: InlB B-repeat-containing protein, partial [Nitrospinae bacterium]|nr:InlB B-repeat-containing protein [Nitrospinota bacterium]